MKVLFYGGVLEFTKGEKEFEFEDCSSVRELINELGSNYGQRFKDFLLGKETCFFLVNGKGLMMTGGPETKINPGDKIEVLPFADAG